MVSIVILIGIVALILSMTQQTSNVWKNTSGKIQGFGNARAAFDAMTRTISQATLNTYYDYVDSTGAWATNTGNPPVSYNRRSDLEFVCGQGSTLLSGMTTQTPITHCIFFQSPLGRSTLYTNQQRLMNACGFYLVYGPDPNVPSYLPSSFAARYRYRLMQFVQPSESLTVYNGTGTTTTSWFTTPIATTYDSNSNFVLAENIIALIIWPKLSAGDQATGGNLTTNYSYDTRQSGATFNQLPPVVEVTMVAMDETSALQLGNTTTPPNATLGLTSTLFQTSTLSPNQLQADLTQMEATLVASHINFHVFQTEVALAGAKWTTGN